MYVSKIFKNTKPLNTPSFDHVLASCNAEATEMLKRVSSKSVTSFPMNMDELGSSSSVVQEELSQFFDINLTKKRINKLYDYTCLNQYGLKGGVQQLKSHWKEARSSAIQALEHAKTFPEQVYLLLNGENQRQYMILDPEAHNIRATKYGIESDTQYLFEVDVENPELNENVCELNEEQEAAMIYGYNVVNMAIDSSMSCGGSSEFTGSMVDDVKYLKDVYGLTPSAHKEGVESFMYYASNSEVAITLLLLTRPDDETLDQYIEKLKG